MAVGVRGFVELDRVLATLPDVVQVSVLGAAVAKGGEIIRAGAEARAPRRTGELAGGMTMEIEATRGGVTAHVGPGKEQFWGLFQEFGTVRQAAQPFLRPAIDEDGPEAVQVLGDALGAGVEREAARLNKATAALVPRNS